VGLNPAKDNGFLSAIKICSMTYFGGEVKPVVPCQKILQHVKDPYSMKEILLGTCRQNLQTFLAKFLPASLLGVPAGYCHRAPVGESEMIITQIGKHNRSVMVVVYGTPCAVLPQKSNSNSNGKVLCFI
jgi:hypothetical protein